MRRFTVWCACLAAVWGLAWPGNAARAQEILIVRPLENSKAQVTISRIEFEVLVSAFEPVTSITINGEAQKFEPGTTVRVKILLELKPGKNIVEVEAATEEEEEAKEFEIIYRMAKGAVGKEEEKEKKEKGATLQVVNVLGLEFATNVAKFQEGSTGTEGLKTFFVIVPKLDIPVGDESTLRLQSIVSREKYDKRELRTEEIAFTQFTAAWIIGFGETVWTLGIGHNMIDQGYDSLLQGETKLQRDNFLFSSLRFGLGGKFSSLELSLELKNQDFVEEPADQDEDEDAQVTTLGATLLGDIWVFRSRLKTSLASNNAQGRFKEKDTFRLSEELSHVFESFILGFGLRLRRNAFRENNPTFGEKPTETLLTYFLKGTWVISASWMLTGRILTETQRSNVPESEFKNTAVGTSAVYVF